MIVPNLTFGDVALCMRSEVQVRFKIKQHGAGRVALGAHGYTPNQGIHGDMGWTSFESKEAPSKIGFLPVLIFYQCASRLQEWPQVFILYKWLKPCFHWMLMAYDGNNGC